MAHDLRYDMHYMQHKTGCGELDEYEYFTMMGVDPSMIPKGGKKKKLELDARSCLFCALESNDTQVCKEFFLNYHKHIGNEDVILTPISSLTEMMSTADDLQNFVDLECINMLLMFLKSPVRYIPFYASRMIDMLTRDRCGLVLMKLKETEEEQVKIKSENLVSVKMLIENLTQLIHDMTCIEKREALLSLSHICKFIVQEDTLDEDLYVENVYQTAQRAKDLLLESKCFKALVHSLKVLNMSQFKGESNVAEPALKKVPKSLYTKYNDDCLDPLKFGRGAHQENILSRGAYKVLSDETYMRFAMTDFQRSLAKAIYRFSLVQFDKEKAINAFKPLVKDFVEYLTKLLTQTKDYPTICYLMGALESFNEKGFLQSGPVEDIKNSLPYLLFENLKKQSTDILNVESMKKKDTNFGWAYNSYPLLPERGWSPNSLWIEQAGTLEKEYHETDLRLEVLSNSVREMLLKAGISEESINGLEKSETAPKASQSVCAVCKKIATKKCANCKSVCYCSAECQKKHWSVHKKVFQFMEIREIYPLQRVSGFFFRMIEKLKETYIRPVYEIGVVATHEEQLESFIRNYLNSILPPKKYPTMDEFTASDNFTDEIPSISTVFTVYEKYERQFISKQDRFRVIFYPIICHSYGSLGRDELKRLEGFIFLSPEYSNGFSFMPAGVDICATVLDDHFFSSKHSKSEENDHSKDRGLGFVKNPNPNPKRNEPTFEELKKIKMPVLEFGTVAIDEKVYKYQEQSLVECIVYIVTHSKRCLDLDHSLSNNDDKKKPKEKVEEKKGSQKLFERITHLIKLKDDELVISLKKLFRNRFDYYNLLATDNLVYMTKRLCFFHIPLNVQLKLLKRLYETLVRNTSSLAINNGNVEVALENDFIRVQYYQFICTEEFSYYVDKYKKVKELRAVIIRFYYGEKIEFHYQKVEDGTFIKSSEKSKCSLQ